MVNIAPTHEASPPVPAPRARKGKPVSVQWRAQLARDVDALGDEFVAREIGICTNTLARVLAGLCIYGGTYAATRAYIERTRRAA